MSTRRSTRSARKKGALEEVSNETDATPSQSQSFAAEYQTGTEKNAVEHNSYMEITETNRTLFPQILEEHAKKQEAEGAKLIQTKALLRTEEGGGIGSATFKPLVKKVEGAIRLVDLARTPEGSSLTVVALLAFLLALAATLAFYVDPLSPPPVNFPPQSSEAGPRLTAQLAALDNKLSAVEGSLGKMAGTADVESLRTAVTSLEARVTAQEKLSREHRETESKGALNGEKAVGEMLKAQQSRLDAALEGHTLAWQTQAEEQRGSVASAATAQLQTQSQAFTSSLHSAQEALAQALSEAEQAGVDAKAAWKAEGDELRAEGKREREKAKKGLLAGQSQLPDLSSMVDEKVRVSIDSLLADFTHLPDYALHSSGGRVVGHSTLHWTQIQGRGNWPWAAHLGWPDWVHPNANKWLLTSSLLEMPGDCLALSVAPVGEEEPHVDIKLRAAIIPTALTLRHIHQDIAFNISSAPKEVMLQGWMSPSGSKSLMDIGKVTYESRSKSPVQTFQLNETTQTFGPIDHIRLKILSNHGHNEYTCLYRVHVHGTPTNA
mmetsp:Transcript_32581/g.45203  ORF Transcript_32581/g.45203 Transcript_32581/m.45203 type:complete len:549 (+) Transcript_32581:211-1857(+)